MEQLKYKYKLSVIVPVYNTEPWLKQCIESLLQQTYSYLEIILVDDGSSDNSWKILQEYRERDTRVMVCHQEKAGAAAARKQGMTMATGDYVTFVDSDDWIEKNAYERMMCKIEQTQADIVITNAYYLEKSGTSNVIKEETVSCGEYRKEKIEIIREQLFAIFPSLCLKIFRKESIYHYIENVREEIKIGNDLAASYPAIIEADSVVVTDEIYYHYRVGHRASYGRSTQEKIVSYSMNYFIIKQAVESKDASRTLNSLVEYIMKKVIPLLYETCNDKKKEICIRVQQLRDIRESQTVNELVEDAGIKSYTWDKIMDEKLWKLFWKKKYNTFFFTARMISKIRNIRKG